MTRRLGVVALAIVGVTSVVRPATAQTAAPAAAVEPWPCKPGCSLVESDELRVTDADGVVGQGRLRAFDAESIRFTRPDGGEVAIERDRVRRNRPARRWIAQRNPHRRRIRVSARSPRPTRWAPTWARPTTLGARLSGPGWERCSIISTRDGPASTIGRPRGSANAKASHAFWIAPSSRGLRVGFTSAF